MKRLYIIVEGQSEEEFVNELLVPYFHRHSIYDTRPIKIGKKGGSTNFDRLKNDATKYLNEGNVVVSTFIDFFRLPKKQYPHQEECFKKNGTDEIINCLEKAMESKIGSKFFIPYIQKHEFEALLFSSNKGFDKYFDFKISNRTAEIVNSHQNPEDINTTSNGAPSKRILEIIPDYDKVENGTEIAQEIGIETILQKCPRFAAWVQKLIEKTNN